MKMKDKIIMHAITIIGCTIFIVCTFIGAYLFALDNISQYHLPAPVGSTTKEEARGIIDTLGLDARVAEVAATGSMLPVMNETTVLIVADEPVKVGDLAIYRNDEGISVVHRIIGETANGEWIFHGDNIHSGNIWFMFGFDENEIVRKDQVEYRVKMILY